MNDLYKFESLLTKAINNTPLVIPNGAIPLLVKHYHLLAKWDSTFNLTSLGKIEDIIDRLYIDSLLFLNELPRTTSLLDIGSGPGFPGIPLLTAIPKLKLTILEPKRKMCAFLSETKYAFENQRSFEIINMRCDSPEFIQSNSQRFPTIISKAFAPPHIALHLILPIIKPNGLYATCINPDTPLDPAPYHGYELSSDHVYNLPLTGKTTRHLIFHRKNPL